MCMYSYYILLLTYTYSTSYTSSIHFTKMCKRKTYLSGSIKAIGTTSIYYTWLSMLIACCFPWGVHVIDLHAEQVDLEQLVQPQVWVQLGFESGPYRGSEWRTNKHNWLIIIIIISGLPPGEVWTSTRGCKMWHIVSSYCVGNTQDIQNTA